MEPKKCFSRVKCLSVIVVMMAISVLPVGADLTDDPDIYPDGEEVSGNNVMDVGGTTDSPVFQSQGSHSESARFRNGVSEEKSSFSLVLYLLDRLLYPVQNWISE